MKKNIFLLGCLLPLFSFSQADSVLSGNYSWKEPPLSEGMPAVVLFEGRVEDMQWLQMSANRLPAAGNPFLGEVPVVEEQVLIVRSGKLQLLLNDTLHHLGAGSVAVLMPGQRFSLQAGQGNDGTFYLLKYRSKKPADMVRAKAAGGSLVVNYDSTAYHPHDKGGRREYFERPTAMGRRLEMHISTLNPGLKSHDPHIHRAEEMVLVMDGNTEMQVGERFQRGAVGSIYYLGSNVPHAIQNIGPNPSTYIAFQFE